MRNFKKYFKFFCGWRLVFAVIYLLSFTIVKSIENDIFSPVSPFRLSRRWNLAKLTTIRYPRPFPII